MEASELKTNCRNWFQFLNLTRREMQNQGFEEVVTPLLVPSGAMEFTLQPFKTHFRFGQHQQEFELPTSPEFHLKKLLALGWGSIFEIKTCFRNEEYSKIHRPEFTMLEFYQVHAKLNDLQATVKNLIVSLVQQCSKTAPKWRSVTMADLFLDRLGFVLTPETSEQELQTLCHSQNVIFDKSDDFDDLFFRLWLERIEPNFDPQELLVVSDFPPSQAALAQISQQGWAERFEIYWKGFELGNAFYELKNSDVLKKRVATENKKRQEQQWAAHPEDAELYWATDLLPMCSGIAIGLERLFMAIYDLEKISDFKIQDLKTKLAQT